MGFVPISPPGRDFVTGALVPGRPSPTPRAPPWDRLQDVAEPDEASSAIEVVSAHYPGGDAAHGRLLAHSMRRSACALRHKRWTIRSGRLRTSHAWWTR